VSTGSVSADLPKGARLGPYEIQRHIASGGMGDVYGALDTRLGRIVALKLVSDRLAHDSRVRAQFETESRIVASLNHPNICTLLDVGHAGGRHFLVFEYLEGETLAGRLKRGPLSPRDLFRVASDILAALEHAHRRGVRHCDLKPANVLLTATGAKLLDFGLARFTRPADRFDSSGETQAQDTGAKIGQGGMAERSIVGTLPYLSPEQLEGHEGDSRSDIFAFGAVLFEMATGEKAFAAASDAAVIAAVLTSHPPRISYRDGLPLPALDDVIKRCLAKAPDERWASAGDVLAILRLLFEASPSGTTVPTNRGISKRGITAAGLLLAIAIAAFLAYSFERTSESSTDLVRFNVSPPANVALSPGAVEIPGAEVALSPDGATLAFVAAPAGGRRLIWTRRLSDVDARPVAGTAGALHPFWSPSGSQIGYFADGKLMRVDLTGGRPQILADAPDGHGASWSRTGDILFSLDGSGPVYRVHETGGARTQITVIDQRRGEAAHRWPEFLPDGRHFLFFVASENRDIRGIYEGNVDTRDHKLIIASSFHGTYAEPGYLLFVRDGDLVAQRFQYRTGERSGAMSTLVRNVGGAGHGHGSYSVSSKTVAYATPFDPERELVWFARSGERLERADGPADYVDFRVSRNGRIAVARNLPDLRTSDIFIVESRRNSEHRVTSHPALDASPVWSPDSTRLVFRSKRRERDTDGFNDLYEVVAEGLGTERLLLSTPAAKYPTDWSPDGSAILYHTESTGTGWDIWVLPLGDDPAPRPLIVTKANERQARISSDGRYVAYSSDASGRPEVYVKTYPPDNREWQVSTGGGTQPEWTRTGRELLFMALDGTLMSASIAYTPQFQIERRRAELTVPVPGIAPPFSPSYAVSMDGKKVLVNVRKSLASAPKIEVMLNWRALLTMSSP
jgi:eukaryotic-like serine/threonine-protein kinase